MGYLQHGRRHAPGGTDPIPGLSSGASYPRNDDFPNAIPLLPSCDAFGALTWEGSTEGTNRGATTDSIYDPLNVAFSDAGYGGKTVWYKGIIPPVGDASINVDIWLTADFLAQVLFIFPLVYVLSVDEDGLSHTPTVDPEPITWPTSSDHLGLLIDRATYMWFDPDEDPGSPGGSWQYASGGVFAEGDFGVEQGIASNGLLAGSPFYVEIAGLGGPATGSGYGPEPDEGDFTLRWKMSYNAVDPLVTSDLFFI